MKRKVNKSMIIFSILNLIFTISILYCCISLNVIPIKYIFILIILLFLMNFGVLCLLKTKNKIAKGIGIGISVIFGLMSIFGMYYLNQTNNFLDKSFNHNKNIYEHTYYVVTKNKEIDKSDINTIGYYSESVNVSDASNKLVEYINPQQKKYEDLYDVFNDLNNNQIDAILIEQTLYDFVIESNDNFKAENYKIFYTFNIQIEEEIEVIQSNNDSFSIYIGGADFTGLYNDFNMIVTVNKATGKILLTSTPRDFYVEVDGKGGGKDLLGYAGVWGINTSRKTLENLYDVNIDYYLKINTKSLVGLVDTLGGLEFCSDISYTTTHATILDSYDDTKGKKLKVSKGCKTYSGVEILTIARERKAFADGDRQRQRNCQQIMINIFNKMISPELITNYSNILNAVSDLYTTNIPKELVTELAKNTLNGAKWTIEQQSVTGSDSRGHVHFSHVMDYVMVPNSDSVNQASLKIKMVEAGK